MSYQRFKPAGGEIGAAKCSNVAELAGDQHISASRAHTPPTAKFNNNNNTYNKGLHHSEAVSLPEKAAEPRAPISAYVDHGPANSATSLHFRAAIAAFRKHRPHGVTGFRHDQACWAAEMFITEWSALASSFGWQPDDIFARGGLAWWLGVEVVRALGPEHAITEAGRVFDRMTRADWLNPYGTPGND